MRRTKPRLAMSVLALALAVALALSAPVAKAWGADALTFFDLGIAAWQQGRYDAAIASFNESIRLKPDFAEAHNSLGWVYNKTGRYDAAIAAYKEALRLKPDFAEAHKNLGAA